MRIAKEHCLLYIAVLVMSSIITAVAFFHYTIYDVETVPVDYVVPEDNVAAFNLDNDTVHFGSIPRGGSGERSVVLEYDRDTFVVITLKGLPHVAASDNNFLLKADMPVTVTLKAEVPMDADFGRYSGKLRVVYRRP